MCARTKDKCSGGSRKTMMAATSDERTVMESTRANSEQNQVVDRLKMLYPMVNEEETPLPRSWSPKDKYNYIGLSQNNLRVHYKGKGLTYIPISLVLTIFHITYRYTYIHIHIRPCTNEKTNIHDVLHCFIFISNFFFFFLFIIQLHLSVGQLAKIL